MSDIRPVKCLPGQFYTDPVVLDAEQTEIFRRTWQFVCHIESLRNPGDYLVCDIGTENVILIADDDGTVRGFFNVCAHRASRLLENCGNTRKITCPYHGWTYSKDGRLAAAPNASNVPGFDKGCYGLKSFPVEVVNGLVFANLDGSAPDFEAFAPGLAQTLTRFSPNLGELTFVHRTEATVKGNWKVAIENFSECYHCALLHPDLVTRVIEFDCYRIHVHPHWHHHYSVARHSDNQVYDYGEQGNQAEEFGALWMWPNFAFQNYPGGAGHVWKWHPISESSTHVTVDWYFQSTDLQPWQKDLITHHADYTFAEDLPIIEKVQSGLGSKHFVPGPVMADASSSELSEHGVADIQGYWREHMHHWVESRT